MPYARKRKTYKRAPFRKPRRFGKYKPRFGKRSQYRPSHYSQPAFKTTASKTSTINGRQALAKRLQFKRLGLGSRALGSNFSGSQLSIVPDRYFTKLNYADHRQAASGGATSGLQQYRGNGIFDPDFTNTGGQPRGYDQLALLYQYYRVFASKIKVRYASATGIPTGQSIGSLMLAAGDLSSSVSTASDPLKECELPRTKAKIFRYGSTDQPMGEIKRMYKTKNIWGLNKEAVANDDTFAAAITANPTNQWYWSIIWRNGDDATALNLFIWVQLTYYCEFFNRVELSSS